MKKIASIFKISILMGVLLVMSCENDDDSLIDTKPVAAFKVSETTIIAGNPVLITDLSFDRNGSVSAWIWDFGNGETSTEQSPIYTYPELGEFIITLTVTDNAGNTNVNEFSRVVSVLEPSTLTTEPEQLWVFDLPALVDKSSPAVSDDGTVYIGCDAMASSNVFAIKNGTEVWSYATEEQNRTSAAIDANGNIFIGSNDDYLYGITPAGSSLFKIDLGGNAKFSSPVFGADGTIYIGSKSDELVAVSSDGVEKWRFDAGKDVTGTAAIGDDGTIYVAAANGKFFALNPDGTKKWESKYGIKTSTAVALGEDGTIYLAAEGNYEDVSYAGILIAYNPDGSEKWHVNLASKFVSGGPVVGADGTIYAGGEGEELVAYNPEDGSVKWTYSVSGTIMCAPAIGDDGNIYITDMGGNLHVIDLDGNKKWKEAKLGTSIISSPTIGPDGTIYVAANQDGGTCKLYALKTKATGLAQGGWPMLSGNAKHTGRY